MALVLKSLAVLAGLAALLFLGAQSLQRTLMYLPDQERVSPQQAGLFDVEEVELPTGDGVRVLAWHAKAQPGRPTLLYFHGNAGSLVTRAERIRRYQARGYGVFMMTYRGYGGSSGKPSERANVKDAETAYRALLARGVPAMDIVVYGESLGTGIAIQLVSRVAVAGVILDAPYTSMLELAGLHYPELPAGFFLTDRYDSLSKIGDVKVPVLIVHGDQDGVVPLEMGERLFQALTGDKEIAVMKGAGHTDHNLFGSYDVIFAWLARHGG